MMATLYYRILIPSLDKEEEKEQLFSHWQFSCNLICLIRQVGK